MHCRMRDMMGRIGMADMGSQSAGQQLPPIQDHGPVAGQGDIGSKSVMAAATAALIHDGNLAQFDPVIRHRLDVGIIDVSTPLSEPRIDDDRSPTREDPHCRG